MRNLPDFTYVEAIAEPSLDLVHYPQRAQYLYVRQANLKWWSGFFFELDVARLTGGRHPAALLDLAKPLVPTVHAPPIDGIQDELTPMDLYRAD